MALPSRHVTIGASVVVLLALAAVLLPGQVEAADIKDVFGTAAKKIDEGTAAAAGIIRAIGIAAFVVFGGAIIVTGLQGRTLMKIAGVAIGLLLAGFAPALIAWVQTAVK